MLGLLEPAPMHGYTLRRRYDDWFGGGRAIASAQVYSSLRRLARSDWVELAGVEAGGGPERRVYRVTGPGVAELERWLAEPLVPDVRALRQELFAKVVVAALTRRRPREVLDRQRHQHLARMRQLRELRQSPEVLTQLDADFEMFHLEADLRWIDAAEARVTRLAARLEGAGDDQIS